jgi:hypothetical protein
MHRDNAYPHLYLTLTYAASPLAVQASDLTGLLARAGMALYAARQDRPDPVRYLEGPGEESGTGAAGLTVRILYAAW